MKFVEYILICCLFVILGLHVGCEERPPLVAEQPETRSDTSYLQIEPAFGSYPGAEDIMVGRDQLLYVADTRWGPDHSGRVVMLNRAGQEMSWRAVLHPISLTQTTNLDLLVGAEAVAANGDTVGSILRIHLVPASHNLGDARIDTVWRELARPNRRFPGITAFDNNTYLAVRTALPFPDNSSFIDPDARVLQFSGNDVFITPVPAFTSGSGSVAGGITTIYQPTAIASFSRGKDFVLVQTAADSSVAIQFGALWMKFQLTNDFEGWLPAYDPDRPEDRSVDFIRSYRFRGPQAVAIDQNRQDVFVADATLDSVFKFNSRGRVKQEAFGYYRTGGVMRRPTGLAFFEKVLYVLDGNSGMILRFRLTTDVPR
jgi:hypothetical protein